MTVNNNVANYKTILDAIKRVESQKGGKSNNTKNTDATDKIRNFLNIHHQGQSEKVKPKENDADKKNSSKVENYTYTTKDGRKLEGKLYYKKNGIIKFVSTGENGKYEATFISKEKFNKNLPSEVSAGDIKGIHTNTVKYEYGSNDKPAKIVKLSKSCNSEPKIVSEELRNEKGQPTNIKLYDNEGKLNKEIVYEDIDESTRVSKTYNNKREIIETSNNKYKDGEISERTVYDKDNKIIRSMQYENGKVATRNIYKNGILEKTYEYFVDNGGIKAMTTYDESGKVVSRKEIEQTPDGNFGLSKQIGQGDCYLLATINAIREADGGQDVLKSLVSTSAGSDGKKIYTVTLPGAKMAANSLSKDKNIAQGKMHITGIYTFTQDELDKILKQSGTRYSFGDADVVLLEAAFEKFRQECAETIQENNLKESDSLAGLVKPLNHKNQLAGGYGWDATFILTGKPSKLYQVEHMPESGLDNEALKQGKIKISGNSAEMVKAAPSEIDGERMTTKGELSKMLDDIQSAQNDSNNGVTAVVGFNTMKNGKKVGGHAFTVKRVTDNEVILVNPWEPDKELTMSRKDFEANAVHISYTELDKNYTVRDESIESKQNTNRGKKKEDAHEPEKKHNDNDMNKLIKDGINKLKKQKAK